jgi:hypothetical protein
MATGGNEVVGVIGEFVRNRKKLGVETGAVAFGVSFLRLFPEVSVLLFKRTVPEEETFIPRDERIDFPFQYFKGVQ